MFKELKNYDLIPTDDGSFTLFSKAYGENCHSTSGAIDETNLHYIKGCAIPELANKLDEISVLEVGFGLGVGFEQTLKACENKCFLNFVSFEIDPELIEAVLNKNNYSFTKSENEYLVKTDSFFLRVFYGNAREKIKLLISDHAYKYHAIFQDAFSPKRNAILWTTEWFKDLKVLAHADCILSTYSSSSSIRKSLIAAGWTVFKGEKFGPKRSSTRAKLTGKQDPDIITHLERSPAVEITDDNYKTYTLKDNK